MKHSGMASENGTLLCSVPHYQQKLRLKPAMSAMLRSARDDVPGTPDARHVFAVSEEQQVS
jgi:hypothetical protein